MSDERISDSSESSDAGAAHSPADDVERRDGDVQSSVEPRSHDLPREYGGRKGPEPVRYGDWEKNGRCIDF